MERRVNLDKNRESNVIILSMSVLNIMMTVDFLFLPNAALLSIYLHLKPLLSKLLALSSADKKSWYTT